jgi:hypothetical protein
MTFSWQDIAAVIVIAAAAIYIIMRLFRLGPWKRKPFCDSCETCAIDHVGLPLENNCPDAGQQIKCEQHTPAESK